MRCGLIILPRVKTGYACTIRIRRLGNDQVVPLALRLGPVTLERAGRYALILRYEGEETARTAFDLVLNRPAPPRAKG